MGIQRAIQDTVTQRFSSELASGALSFREVNTEEPANAHFATDFDLSSSGMVLVARHGETTVKWLNCEQVWPLAHDTVALGNYAESQIRAYLALLGKS